MIEKIKSLMNWYFEEKKEMTRSHISWIVAITLGITLLIVKYIFGCRF